MGCAGAVEGECDGPKPIIVYSFWMVEVDLAVFGEFIAFLVEAVEELAVVGVAELFVLHLPFEDG